jgi:hypothetical protein
VRPVENQQGERYPCQLIPAGREDLGEPEGTELAYGEDVSERRPES